MSNSTHKCQRCQDEFGYLVLDSDGIERFKPCEECATWRKTDRLLKNSKITDEFRKLTFDTFTLGNKPQQIANAYHSAKYYADNFETIRKSRNNGFALLGSPGTGKTHLCTAIINSLLSRNIGAVYFPFVEGFNELKNNLDELDQRIGLLQEVDVLFIDDLWKGRKEPTPFQIEQMFAVINHRYMNNKPIVISSEYSIDHINRFDEALGSRIYQMSKDFCMVLHGKDINHRMK